MDFRKLLSCIIEYEIQFIKNVPNLKKKKKKNIFFG